MADFNFKCPHCARPLVADDTDRGSMINCPACSKELKVPLAMRAPAPVQSEAQPEHDEEYRHSTKALFFGILSVALCCGPFTGLPAVILGHKGLSAISATGGTMRGHGKCLAGLIMGYISIVIFPIIGIMAALILPALGKARERANEAVCKNNLKQIGRSIAQYYSDGSVTVFPTGPEASGVFDGVDAAYWGVDAVLWQCPSQHDDGQTHYVWNPAVAGMSYEDASSSSFPLLWDASAHKLGGQVTVLFGDGHVESVDPANLPR